MIPAIVAIAILLTVQSVQPQAGVIGLLTLPQVFGTNTCVPFTPRPVPLFRTPRAQTPVAHVRVDKDWTFHEDGGCTPLDVRTYQPHAPAAPLPSREFAPDMPAAIVVGRDGDWFRIQTAHGPLWLHGTAENKYFPVAKHER